jgi:hypothetical protein
LIDPHLRGLVISNIQRWSDDALLVLLLLLAIGKANLK